LSKKSYMKASMIIPGIALVAIACFAGIAFSTGQDGGASVSGANYKALLKVDGMSCSGCIFTIKNSLAEFEGIADVQVDVAAGTTAIVYDKAQQPDAGKMAAAITASGYPARVLRILSPEQVAQEARQNQAKSATAIAVVGGVDVPRADFETEMAHARGRYEMVYGGEALGTAQGQRLLDNLKAQIAGRLINESIQLQEVQRSGFSIDPLQVTQAYQEYWQKRGFADSSAFETELRQNGYPPAYFIKRFGNQVLINTYIDQEVMTAHLNDIEKRQRYADWFANARLLAEVTYYDKDLERLMQSSSGSCGNSCSTDASAK